MKLNKFERELSADERSQLERLPNIQDHLDALTVADARRSLPWMILVVV